MSSSIIVAGAPGAASVDGLQRQILDQGARVRDLKLAKVDKEQVDAAVAVLLNLKKQLAALTGEAVGDKKGKLFTLKTPKGTRDYTDKEMAIRGKIFSTIVDVFQRHGAVTIDTPEILSGKYGEDSKLIYDLEDQGGEKCSLRYDLTVPFARFLAMNGAVYQNIKRYHIAKVYRRDQPAMTKGRMREFYQCDFDIAGTYEKMVPDAEVVRITVEILDALDVGAYSIKLNHRKLLDGIFEVCGVPQDRIRPISSAVDKLDKLPWEAVRHEMTHDKGLDESAADRIGEYVKLRGGRALLAKLEADERLNASAHAREGLADMALVFRYLDIYGVLDRISFDLSLARGLDYYTGIIYEATLLHQPEELSSEKLGIVANAEDEDASIGVGSIAGGGRYDELVNMFAAGAGGKKPVQIPCVGVSIGVERVFSILLRRTQLAEVKANHCEVYVIAVGDGLLEDRMRICSELWSAGISAEFMYKNKPKLQPQFNVCDRDMIPLAVIIGRDEVDAGVVKIKDMREKKVEEQGGVSVTRGEMVAEIKRRLGKTS